MLWHLRCSIVLLGRSSPGGKMIIALSCTVQWKAGSHQVCILCTFPMPFARTAICLRQPPRANLSERGEDAHFRASPRVPSACSLAGELDLDDQLAPRPWSVVSPAAKLRVELPVLKVAVGDGRAQPLWPLTSRPYPSEKNMLKPQKKNPQIQGLLKSLSS